jgi:poly-D-alanine transfer protein DltD
MRHNNLIVLVTATFAACATGFANVGESIQNINYDTTSNHKLVGAQRMLREDLQTAAREERLKKIPGLSAMASLFQKSPKVGKVLSKNPSLAKAMKDPQVGESLKALQKDTSLVKSLKSSPLLKNPAKVLKTNPSKLTTKDVEQIGAAALRSTGTSRGIGYFGGMFIAAGIFFLVLLIGGVASGQ